MNKLNRLVRNSDLKWISEVRDENNWIEKYPWRTPFPSLAYTIFI